VRSPSRSTRWSACHRTARVELVDQAQQRVLSLRCVLPAHRDVVEFDAVGAGQVGAIVVVGYDRPYVDLQRARLPTEQQIVEAVAGLRHHDQSLL
jgi:hypothetical protein